ncbi:MAG: phosphatase PAP2 family protein [Candidatus Woesearchaeota archaeon]
MFKDEVWQDIKGLSGVPIFVVIIISSFLLGNKQLAFQLLAGFILAYVVTIVIRFVYFKRRPDRQAYKNIIEKIDASSFPSLHAMRAAVLATILSITFHNNLLTALFAFCAICVATSRVMTKRHYISDVIVGLILGVIIGWLATFIS